MGEEGKSGGARPVARRIGAGTAGGAAVGFSAGWFLGVESLARNPGISGARDVAIVLLFFALFYALAGALIGAAATSGLLLLPRRLAGRLPAGGHTVGAGVALGVFLFAELFGRCYGCHQWYRALIPSLTITVAESFRRFLLLLLVALVVALFSGWGIARVGRRVGRSAGRRRAAAAVLPVLFVASLAAALAGRPPPFLRPAYTPEMVDPSGCGVRLIVMDGADWDFIDPVMRAGRMPHLEALIERGVRGELGVSSPTISPYLWTCLSTGLDDDAHGLCDFFAYRPPGSEALVTRYPGVGNSKRFLLRKLAPILSRAGIGKAVYASSVQKRAGEVWDYLGDAGKEVCVVGWRYSWPATPVRGVMVTEKFGPVDRKWPLCYPEDLQERLRRDYTAEAAPYVRTIIDEPMAGAPAEDVGRLRARRKKVAYQIERDIKFTNTARVLIDSLQPDFAAIGLSTIDALEHKFIVEHVLGKRKESGPLGAYFRRFTSEELVARLPGVIEDAHAVWDSLLGVLIDGAGNDMVVVVSDHGHDLDGSGHRFGPRGIVVLAGGPVVSGASLAGATVYDIAPTILHVSGLPVPAGFPGRVLTEALDRSWLAAHPVRILAGGEGEEAIVTPRAGALPELGEKELEDLKALGYVD